MAVRSSPRIAHSAAPPRGDPAALASMKIHLPPHLARPLRSAALDAAADFFLQRPFKSPEWRSAAAVAAAAKARARPALPARPGHLHVLLLPLSCAARPLRVAAFAQARAFVVPPLRRCARLRSTHTTQKSLSTID